MRRKRKKPESGKSDNAVKAKPDDSAPANEEKTTAAKAEVVAEKQPAATVSKSAD